MVQVILRKTWFAPNGLRYKEGQHEINDKLAKSLPSTAKVIEEEFDVEDLDIKDDEDDKDVKSVAKKSAAKKLNDTTL